MLVFKVLLTCRWLGGQSVPSDVPKFDTFFHTYHTDTESAGHDLQLVVVFHFASHKHKRVIVHVQVHFDFDFQTIQEQLVHVILIGKKDSFNKPTSAPLFVKASRFLRS